MVTFFIQDRLAGDLLAARIDLHQRQVGAENVRAVVGADRLLYGGAVLVHSRRFLFQKNRRGKSGDQKGDTEEDTDYFVFHSTTAFHR